MLRCAYCHADAEPGAVACPRCRTVLHRDCFDLHGKCPTLGCGAPPPPGRIRSTLLVVTAFIILPWAAFFAVVVPIELSRGEVVPPPAAPSEAVEPAPPPSRAEPPRLPVVWANAPEAPGRRTETPPSVTWARTASPEFVAWARCGKGSFVEFEVVTPVSRRVTKTTVAAVHDDSITLETLETVLLEGGKSESYSTTREVPATGEGVEGRDEPSRFRRLALGSVGFSDADEELHFKGRTVHGRRIGLSTEEGSARTFVWCCDDVPGGLYGGESHRVVTPEWPVRVTLLSFFNSNGALDVSPSLGR